MRHKLLIAAVSCLVTACAPKLGDSCDRGTDCSANGDRFCDLAQPGGYCTIANCDPGTCGSEGHCVRFRPDEPRLSADWCMAKCSSNSDCDRDDYVCRSAQQLDAERNGGATNGTTKRQALVLDPDKNAKFCVVKARE